MNEKPQESSENIAQETGAKIDEKPAQVTQQPQVKNKRRERPGQVRSEYFPLKEKGDEIWTAIKEYYGLEDVDKN